jgi:hypothetical protein
MNMMKATEARNALQTSLSEDHTAARTVKFETYAVVVEIGPSCITNLIGLVVLFVMAIFILNSETVQYSRLYHPIIPVRGYSS